MTIDLDNQLITDLARETLAEVAPNELELFPAISKAYFRNPTKVLDDAETDKPLGAGTVVGEMILIPVILWLANKIVDLAWDILVKKPLVDGDGIERISQFIKSLLSKLGLGKQERPKALPKMTINELQLLHKNLLADPDFYRITGRYNLSPEQMNQLISRMIKILSINNNCTHASGSIRRM